MLFICEMIEQADASGDGKISFDDFADMMLKRQRPIRRTQKDKKMSGGAKKKTNKKEKTSRKEYYAKVLGR